MMNLKKFASATNQITTANGSTVSQIASGNIAVNAITGKSVEFDVNGVSQGTINGSGLLSTTSLNLGGGSLQINSGGKVTFYGNIASTAGIGIVGIFGATSQKAETGADTNVLTYTPPATAGSYKLHIVIDTSAAVAATIGWTATWTDSNGTAQAPVNLDLFRTGVAAVGLTQSAVAGDFDYGVAYININNAAANIVIKTTFSGTSIAYKVSAWIEQVI